MSRIEQLFKEAKGQTIQLEGRTLVMMDRFELEANEAFELEFEATKSDWRQGVAVKHKGLIRLEGNMMKGPLHLWSDTAPKKVHLANAGDPVSILIYNLWDVGDGVAHSWHNGGAMDIEYGEGFRRYHCNDGYPDEDFDDLIFKISMDKWA